MTKKDTFINLGGTSKWQTDDITAGEIIKTMNGVKISYWGQKKSNKTKTHKQTKGSLKFHYGMVHGLGAIMQQSETFGDIHIFAHYGEKKLLSKRSLRNLTIGCGYIFNHNWFFFNLLTSKRGRHVNLTNHL